MSRRKQAKPIRLQDDGNPSLNGKNIFLFNQSGLLEHIENTKYKESDESSLYQKYIPMDDGRSLMSTSTTCKNSQFPKHYLIKTDQINLSFSVCFDTFAFA